MKDFYTYVWLRADGTPYYVGKGYGDRAFRKGSPPRERIQVQSMPDEATALAYEIYQIDFWGRKDLGTGILRNLTDGGEGNRGWSVVARAETSKRFKDRTYEELYGEKKAAELREARSKQWKDKPKPRKQRDKMSAAALGKPKAYPTWQTGQTKESDPRLAAIGKAVQKKLKGKTYEEIYGPEKAKTRREHQSQILAGRKRVRRGNG